MAFLRKLALCVFTIIFFIGGRPVLADNISTLVQGGAGGWLNVTRPLTDSDMKGRIVLLDFWTYGCINCIQIIPDLKILEEKFGDDLLIIGVHSAKFKGEQGNSRILSAAKRFGLEHPVINDSDFAIWRHFKVEAWPTLILLGPDGQEISRFEGEGHRAELERDIQKNITKGVEVSGRAPISSLVASEKKKSILSFPARLKKYGDLFYIADSGNNRIIAVNKDGLIVQTFDGFHTPRGFAVWNNKMLYVTDTGSHSLIAVEIKTGKRERIGGDGTRGRVWASPWDIDFTANENIIIAMAGTHVLNIYDTTRKSLKIFAGNGREDIKDDTSREAELAQPSGLSVGADGSVYFVDAESSALRVVKDGEVKTLIGTGLFDFGFKDGTYPSAQLQHPQGLHVVGHQIYIADTYNNAIRIYDIATGELSTIKTTGEKLNEPGSVWVDNEVALISDTNNNRILRLDLKSGVLSPFKILEGR